MHADKAGERRGGIATVQALRGAACLLVVAYHALDAWAGRLAPPRTADQLWPNGAGGVDLFFVISGFVMAISSGGFAGPVDARRFLARRLRRLVPLYWTLTAAKLAILAASVGPAFLPGLWHVVASLLFVPSRDAAGVVRPVLGVGWTLQFEMLFYLVFAAWIWRRRASAAGGGLPMLLPVLLPLAVAGFFRRAGWPAPLALANGLVLEFCLGVALAGWGWRPRPAIAAGAALLGAALLLGSPAPGPWRFALWGGPAALVLAGAVALEPALGRRMPRGVLALGEASYAIYLVHPFLVPPLARLLAARAPPGLALPALLAASLAASALVGLALDAWIDRPAQRWLAARSQPAHAGRRGPLADAPPQFVQP